MINIDYVKKFYHLLKHEYQTEIRAFELSEDFKVSKCRGHYFVSSEEEFVKKVKGLNGKYNLYAGLNERSKQGTEAKDVISVEHIFLDIDCTTKPASKEGIKEAEALTDKIILDIKNELGAEPTKIFSGNGYQLIYGIPKIEITQENREEVQAKIKQFTTKKIDKYSNEKVKLDNVGDLPRIIRITGTINIKGGHISKFIKINKEKSLKLKDYILNLNLDLKTTTKLKNKTEELELHKKFYTVLDRDDKIKKLYNGDFTGYSLSVGGELALVCSLIQYNFDKKEIFNIMASSKIGRWSERNISYREETYKKALAIINKEKKAAGIKPARVFSRIGQAEQFIESQPLFYDRVGLWWKWNFNKYKYEIVDEVDILNSILDELDIDTINSKARTEILNSLKQVGRKNIPKDAKSRWIQFKNKIVDIETEEEFEATPEYFITNPIPWKLGKQLATIEMNKLFASWVGDDHIEELKEVLAFCLVPEYFIHRIICLIGSGANGKGTFLKLLKRFIGLDNVIATSLDALLSGRFEGAKLYKKLVCLMGETNFSTIKKTEFLKGITGEDTVRGENKGKNPFDFENYAKLIIATNSLPMTQDKTEGYYRRWKIIEFLKKFLKEKDVLKKIPDEEYENLCSQCLQIVKRLWKNRIFINDGDFEQRKKVYEEKSNPLMLFMKKNYVKDLNGDVVFSEFYEDLLSFLVTNGYRELSSRTISTQLKEEGFEIKKTTKNNITTTRILGINSIHNTSNTSNTLNSVLDIRKGRSENKVITSITGISTHKKHEKSEKNFTPKPINSKLNVKIEPVNPKNAFN
jgi:P4 family phage/plasmid primase-like protien